MLDMVNFTKKEYICVGKPGEEPIIQILLLMCKMFNWNMSVDKIEIIRDRSEIVEMGYPGIISEDDADEEDADEEDEEEQSGVSIWTNRGTAIEWTERCKLWGRLKMSNL